MLIDIRTLPENTTIESDICIIGAGAAGISLAKEFMNQPYQVCLLESGGLDVDKLTQSLYGGESVGVPYFPLQESRARYLGGSTNLWGGWCRPLDDFDFESRSWLPYSGWPIAKADLDPYYERAQKICGLGPFEYDFPYWEEALKSFQCHRPSLSEKVETYMWQIVPPTHVRFGEAYKAELERHRNIKVYLYANAMEIETNDTAREVKRLRVASLEGKTSWVSAKVFILAVGGIENSRLLLASNKVQSSGLGNQHDLVGRFFMEHPLLPLGKIQFHRTPALYTEKFHAENTLLVTALGLSETVQKREQILNFSARLSPVVPEWLEAARNIKSVLKKEKPANEAFPTLMEGNWGKRDANVFKDLVKVAANLNSVATKAYNKLMGNSSSNLYQMYLIGEQAPNPDSRVTLSSERDKLGVNRAQLDWRLSPIDRYTIERSQQIIAEELALSGLGQLKNELAEDDTFWQSVRGSYHHIGTTRMSDNPKQGVVDENCQVHGIGNLYIAGSSVFPTSGLSNPTLTIVALAIRLADRLKKVLADSSERVAVTSNTAGIGSK